MKTHSNDGRQYGMTRLLRAAASCLVIAMVLAGRPDPVAAKNPQGKIANPNSKSHGSTLAEWGLAYARWFLTGADPATAWHGNVYFPQLPQGVQGPNEECITFSGHVDFSLPPGRAFFMPIGFFNYERYQNGSVDPLFPPAFLSNAVSMTLDGQSILNPASDYFVRATMNPEIVYPEPHASGSVATISIDMVGVLVHSLTPGVHQIHIVDDFCPAFGVAFDNTFTVTVSH